MPYNRPDLEAVKAELQSLIQRFDAAESYEQARAVFMEKQESEKHIDTLSTLAHLRHTRLCSRIW